MKKVYENLEEALSSYKEQMNARDFKSTGTYCTLIRSIQEELDNKKTSQTNLQLIEYFILPQIKKDNPISEMLILFEKQFKTLSSISNYKKSDCQSALISFAKFILGHYNADLYMALAKESDELNCKLIAQNALFCTIDVAEKVKKGELGSNINKRKKGNKYYSWFNCVYQRAQHDQNRREKLNTMENGEIILDDNTMANQAIKKAIIEGYPSWLSTKYGDFEEYMACHIWDKTCYDYRYHTSVFNLVLLPKSIGGLSDYNKYVKEILQYESVKRFGVYPQGQKVPKKPKYYDTLENLWRQPSEHAKANKSKIESV